MQTLSFGKSLGDHSGGLMNLEAECIRSKAESTGGCVKLKTVTDVTLYGSLQPPANRNIVQNGMMLSLCVQGMS